MWMLFVHLQFAEEVYGVSFVLVLVRTGGYICSRFWVIEPVSLSVLRGSQRVFRSSIWGHDQYIGLPDIGAN